MGEPAITDAMVFAAAKEAWRIGAERFGSSRWGDQSQETRDRALADQRRILTAALAEYECEACAGGGRA